jgi:hypothetical protein
MNPLIAGCALWLVTACSTQAQVINWEGDPIRYSNTVAKRNPIARLTSAIDAGESEIIGDNPLERLDSLLNQLNINTSSQVMVFSKTSLQKTHVSPQTPRAVYFNDEVFVAYVQDGEVEIATADPDLGAVFYTLDISSQDSPRLERQANRCLGCHGAARTGGKPGFQVRSVFPDSNGKPVIRAGSSLSTHRSPLQDRWGGWYVTGQHGDQHHLGGYTLNGKKRPKLVDNRDHENQMTLPACVDVGAYLDKTSDVTALMVMEHQVEAYNLLTHANFVTQHVIWQSESASQSELDAVQRERIAAAVRPLVTYLRFEDEVPLKFPIEGVGSFEREFPDAADEERHQPLRQFDLRTRLFRNRLSYVVNSQTFANVNPLLQKMIGEAIWDSVADDPKLANVIANAGPTWLLRAR